MDISDSVLDSVEDTAMEVSDQNICEEAADWQVDITSEQASINYKGAGAYVDKVENDINWEKYHELFSPELKIMIDKLLSEINLEKLSCFQQIFLHAIGSKKDVFAIASTGVGKTEAAGLAAILLREVFQEPQGLIIMLVPLTGIINELLENKNVATAAVTMNGQIYGRGIGGGRISLGEEDILSGRFMRIVMHPESLKSPMIEKLLLKLKLKQRVVGAIIDEFHINQPRHWASFRPGMDEQSARVRVFLRKGAPTGLLSATASQAEVDLAIESFGLKSAPVVLAESPVKKHVKFVVLKRPSDNYGFEGYTDQKKKFHPGLLHQLRIIYIGEYIRCIQNGEDPKHGIIFFRTENQLILLLNYLREILGQSNVASAPFVSLLSSTPQVTEMVINKRKGSISLYLTTQKMLVGLNIPGLQICIFVKPMNMLHSIIQGAGRTGRPLPGMPDVRTTSLVYILANGGDLGAQVKGMSSEVKDFVESNTGCLKAYLGKFFLGRFNEDICGSDWCCSVCASQR